MATEGWSVLTQRINTLRKPLTSISTRFRSLSPTTQTVVENVVIWTIAALAVWWVARGLTLGKFVASFKHANLPLFLTANLTSFFIWWLGETYLFARLFSLFHKPCSFREVLAPSAAQYFLQVVNILVAAAALVLFLNRRKGVSWTAASWTLLFQGFIDAILLATGFVAAGVLRPQSPIHRFLPYACAALLFFIAVAWWWGHGRPRRRAWQWLYDWPGLHAFRAAGWHEYLELGLIRLAIFLPQGFLFYLEMRAFRADVPLDATLALTPGLLLAAGEPITPSGLGPLQAVMVDGLMRFAPRARLLTAGLAISIMHILCRLPLGVGAAGTFVRRVLTSEGQPTQAQPSTGSQASALAHQ
ncbi:MAG TPA: lysylphosphatidylglycerol synthase domain-containing protein [Candidatus Binataceae bacterium]|nr:lysylphosphatidylglycerol synthase domain-containing protein [Candidatus Binataceae bacterium]